MIQVSKGDFLKIIRMLAYLSAQTGGDIKTRERARQAALLLKKFKRTDDSH